MNFFSKKNIAFYLQLLAGLIFVFAGIIKLFPIEPFEFKFSDYGFSWAMAAVFSRALIIFECILGLALLAHVYPRLVQMVAMLTLMFFNFYLLYVLVFEGNEADCGCFGTFLELTPIQSLLKNGVLLAMLYFAYHNNTRSISFKPWIPLLLIVGISISTIFVISPMNAALFMPTPAPEKMDIVIDKTIFGDYSFNESNIDIYKDKTLLAVMSVSCKHCKHAAMKLKVIEKKMSLPPIVTIFYGDSLLIKPFQKETGTKYPYALAQSEEAIKISNYTLPMLFVLDKGKITHRILPQFLSEEYIKQTEKNN